MTAPAQSSGMTMTQQRTPTCDRCGIAANDTQEGFLAFNGTRRVCSDCDSDLTNEWVADTGCIHPLDALNPYAIARAGAA